MEREKITYGNIDFYAKLDPFELLYRSGLYGHTGVGLKGADGPAGVILLNHIENTLYIEWLYIEEEYRGCGYGEELLKLAYSLALSFGCERVSALCPEYRGRKNVCPIEQGYLMDHFFEEKVSYAPWWNLSLSEVRRTMRIREVPDLTGPYDVEFLGKHPASELKKLMDAMVSTEDAIYLYPPAGVIKTLDPDISCICRQNNKLVGAVTYTVRGDTIYLTSFFAVRKDVAWMLLVRSLQAAAKKYSMDATLNISFLEGGYEDVYGEYFGAGTEVTALVADPKMFLADMMQASLQYDFIEALTKKAIHVA